MPEEIFCSDEAKLSDYCPTLDGPFLHLFPFHVSCVFRQKITVCLHVRGKNPIALASGLFLVLVDNHGNYSYTFTSVDLAHCEIVSMGGLFNSVKSLAFHSCKELRYASVSKRLMYVGHGLFMYMFYCT